MSLGSILAMPQRRHYLLYAYNRKPEKAFLKPQDKKLEYLLCSILPMMPLGVQNGATPGNIISHIHKMGKSYKNLLLRNHESQSFYILCVAMFSNLLYKSRHHLCSWGPYQPQPQGRHHDLLPYQSSCPDQVSVYGTIGPLVL